MAVGSVVVLVGLLADLSDVMTAVLTAVYLVLLSVVTTVARWAEKMESLMAVERVVW